MSDKPANPATTNADVIRSLSNEALAAFMDDCSDCERCYVYGICHENENRTCTEAWLLWLNSPAKSEG